MAGVFVPDIDVMFARKVRNKVLALLANITLHWKGLPGTNPSAYFAHSNVPKKVCEYSSWTYRNLAARTLLHLMA